MNSIFWGSRLSETGDQLVWWRSIGYVPFRDVVRVGVIGYVSLTAIVTILTSDILTLLFLALCGLIVLALADAERFSPRRRVVVYPDGELFIAEHLGTDTLRHGKTPVEALSALDESLRSSPRGTN